jgi:hypothetical protein
MTEKLAINRQIFAREVAFLENEHWPEWPHEKISAPALGVS